MIARERSLGSSPTDLPSAGPGPSGPLHLGRARGTDLRVKVGSTRQKHTKSHMEFLGKIGDPMESDGEKLPDLREVRS